MRFLFAQELLHLQDGLRIFLARYLVAHSSQLGQGSFNGTKHSSYICGIF
jgi:hypothetical protein